MIRYTKEQETTVINAIKKLEGKSVEEKVVSLNADGITTASGTTWKRNSLYYFMLSRRKKLKPKVEKTEKVGVTVAAVSRAVIESLMTDPNLTDKQRVSMVNTYLNT